jgi:mono/diheme cytochrome c family protein
MAKGLLNTCALALVLSQALWALPGARPASAQQVTLPEGFISPNVPHDVPAGSDATIQELALFAWQEFIALNWVAVDPAQTGVRGRPNTAADFLDIAPTNGSFPLVVWQTYRHKNELFPVDGTTDPTFDGYMPTYNYTTNPKMGTGANGQIPSFNLFNNLDETSQIGLDNMFAHSTSVPPEAQPDSGIRVAYEAKVNRAVFSYLVNNGLTNSNPIVNGKFTYGNLTAAQQATSPSKGPQVIPNVGICTPPAGVSVRSIILLPCGDIDTPGDDGEGAIETKSAWRQLTPAEATSGRFFTRNVLFYTGQPPNQLYNNAVWGLVALHIIHKTKSFPAFVFASWERVDDYDDATPANPENLAFQNTGRNSSLPDIAVTRAHAINSPIPPVNDAVHAAFTDPTTGDPDTVWQYYKLIGVQATPVDGPPPATATPDDLSYYYMANIMVETNQVLQNFTGSVTATLPTVQTPPAPAGKQDNVYVNGAPGSPFQMGGCQGCHGFQGQSVGGDMSVLVANGAANSTSGPESIDADEATAVATYSQRVSGIQQRLGLPSSYFFPPGTVGTKRK